jgi:hypothetical protein
LTLPDDAGLSTLLAVAKALRAADAPYLVGGSLASSLLGVPRSTLDVDIVAALEPDGVGSFVAALRGDFYLDEERIRHALSARSSFNVVDLRNGFKADVYLLGEDRYSHAQIARAVPVELLGEAIPFATAEDVILNKLRRFRLGGEVSDRQWLDVLGVLKVQRGALDRVYLDHWAGELALRDLLGRALAQAGA